VRKRCRAAPGHRTAKGASAIVRLQVEGQGGGRANLEFPHLKPGGWRAAGKQGAKI
jgi:hypothetical protein